MRKHSLIFVTGWASDTACWQGVVDELPADLTHVTIGWDACLGNDIETNALFAALGKRETPATLVGWSLGSLAVLAAAARLPERCAGLFLVSGTARMTSCDGYHGTDSRVLKAMRLRLERSREAVLRDFSKLCVSSGGDDMFEKRFVEDAKEFSLESLSEGLRYLENADMRPFLPSIDKPVALVHGEKDRVVPLASAECFAEALPSATLRVLSGQGHALPYTSHKIIAEALKEFLDDACGA